MTRPSYFAMLVLLFSLLSGFSHAETTVPVNINQADAAALASLDGVGEAKAEAIIEYRETHGAFQSVEDLSNVKGIGEKTVAKNAARLSVE